MNAKFWFLSFTTEVKGSAFPPVASNVVLAGIHPLVWLSTPPDLYRRRMVSKAMSFHEIDEDTFDSLRALRYINVEDHREAKPTSEVLKVFTD